MRRADPTPTSLQDSDRHHHEFENLHGYLPEWEDFSA